MSKAKVSKRKASIVRKEVKEFPCNVLNYCPYGSLVEFFPLHGKKEEWNGINLDIEPSPKAKSCDLFGHDCPVQYVAEGIALIQDGKVVEEPDGDSKEVRNISKALQNYVEKHDGKCMVFTSVVAVEGENNNIVDERMFAYGYKEVLKGDLEESLNEIEKEEEEFIVW